jgi:hypothetical protein
MKLPIEEWLKIPTENGKYENEVKNLFLTLENEIREKGLLRPTYLKHRNLHFTRLCRDLYNHSFYGGK